MKKSLRRKVYPIAPMGAIRQKTTKMFHFPVKWKFPHNPPGKETSWDSIPNIRIRSEDGSPNEQTLRV